MGKHRVISLGWDSGRALVQPLAGAGLSLALAGPWGKHWPLGTKGSSTARVPEGEEILTPPAIPFLPQIASLLARHLHATRWIAFGCCCGKERYFGSLLWFVLPSIRSN